VFKSRSRDVATYYCWHCDRLCLPDIPGLTERHYEDGQRLVYFCSAQHANEYRALAALLSSAVHLGHHDQPVAVRPVLVGQ
jgi:hypothetical protein